ncbi:MAG: hypothetical protein LDL47_00400 [Cyanobacteria bacterium KgW148]|nr:hypothetical protein [Cyanobacteria bacterium KgW148]
MGQLIFAALFFFGFISPLWADCRASLDNYRAKQKLRTENPIGYQKRIKSDGEKLQQCRQQSWLKSQGIWLRLYPGDALPGVMDQVLDRIVDLGYSHVFVEVFYDGRVLLPVSQNQSPWRSVTAEAVKEGKLPADTDLWQMAVTKGRERGLKVYGWLFTLNFGYGYGENADRVSVLARNGRGETSISNSKIDRELAKNGNSFYLPLTETEHLFIDPYHPQAQQDAQQIVRQFLLAKPDGMVFDYIRFPNTKPTMNDRVENLWIYGEASRQALMKTAKTSVARQELQNYLDGSENNPQLWQQVTDHAYNGVLQFARAITSPIPPTMPIGTVFFPGGNRRAGQKLDSRMQPWDRFPPSWQRHPMTYGLCLDGKCVAQEVEQVLTQSSPQTLVCPVLAGIWFQPFNGHAPLEVQMAEIRRRMPQITCLSHFVYGWIEPESDRERKFLIPPPSFN